MAQTTPAAGAASFRSRTRLRAAAVAAVVAVVAVIVGGFLGGRATAGGRSEASRLSGDGIELSTPNGWAAADPRQIPGLAFAGARIASAPAGSRRSGLVAGNLRVAYPAFLPPALLDRLAHDPLGSRSVVKVRRQEAYRYQRLAPSGFDGVVTVFAIPRSSSAAAILACYGPRDATVSFAACDRAASTLASDSALTIESPKSYPTAVEDAFRALTTARSSALARLQKARTPAAQAAASQSLVTAYRAAAKAVARATPAPLAAPAQRGVVAALRTAAMGYDALRAAANSGNRRRYRTAAKQIARAESRVNGRLALLMKVVMVPE